MQSSLTTKFLTLLMADLQTLSCFVEHFLKIVESKKTKKKKVISVFFGGLFVSSWTSCLSPDPLKI